MDASCADELRQLAAEVTRMGGLAEAQVADAVDCLAKRDTGMARQLIERDVRLDAMQADIERRAIALIAAFGPSGVDLRRAVSAMKLAMNLERCGDLARNIAKRSLVLADADPTSIMRAIERMGRLVSSRLNEVVDAYAVTDFDRALGVWRRDEEVDDHYESLFRELLELMRQDSATVQTGAHLLFIAKNLERIGDHATNIAEIIHFEITGEELTAQRPKWSSLDSPPNEDLAL